MIIVMQRGATHIRIGALIHVLFCCMALLAEAEVFAQIKIATDFESGSARVVSLDAETQTIRIEPAGDVQRGMPNWWFLRIDGIDTGRPLTLEVAARDLAVPVGAPNAKKLNPNWTLPEHAAISSDGRTWHQTPPILRQGDRGIYRIERTSPTLWLAWGPPFTPADANEWTQRLARDHPSVTPFVLARSREGRLVPGLHICEGTRPSSARPAVFIIARQHAWECGGSWVAVGLAEWLAGDDELAQWLRQNAEIFIVPLMDADHVATGDGGKHARPQDHNRDWIDQPHWPEVAAAQKRILKLVEEKRLALFLDLHNPGPSQRQMTYYAVDEKFLPDPAAKLQLRLFERLRETLGEHKITRDSPPGLLKDWHPEASDGWVATHGNPHTVSLTVETPWNTPRSTQTGYRETGKNLGTAIARFLREPAP